MILSYLAGSVSGAILVGKIFFNIDPRQAGSGNAGSTNALRLFGWKAALPVLVFDLSKAIVSVLGFSLLARNAGLSRDAAGMLCALAVILGHVFPVFYGFKGGKGVAAAAGALSALAPVPALFTFCVFVAVTGFTGYVSLASLVSALAFPLFVMVGLAGRPPSAWITAGSILTALGVFWTHRSNIQRLVSRKEARTEKAMFGFMKATHEKSQPPQ